MGLVFVAVCSSMFGNQFRLYSSAIVRWGRKVTGAAANAAFVVPTKSFAWLAGESIVESFVRSTELHTGKMGW